MNLAALLSLALASRPATSAPPPPGTPTTDFSDAANSQYVALLFEDF